MRIIFGLLGLNAEELHGNLTQLQVRVWMDRHTCMHTYIHGDSESVYACVRVCVCVRVCACVCVHVCIM